MRKDNRTMAILDEHFATFGGAYMLCGATLGNVLDKGFETETYTNDDIDAYYDRKQKEWDEMPDETIDDDGTHHIKARLISFDVEKEIVKATNDIVKAINAGKISKADFIACCANFFKA